MSTVHFVSIPSKRLKASIIGSDFVFQLSDVLGWDGFSVDPSIFGQQAYAVFRDDANSVMEIMEIDPSTVADGNPISVIQRGLSFDGSLTNSDPSRALTWIKNTTIVELGTDVPQLLNHMVQIDGAQTIAGQKHFTSIPGTDGSPSASTDLATKAYVDSVVTGTTTFDQGTLTGVAGETLVAGNFVYFEVASQRWWKTSASAASTSQKVKLGVAQASATAGQSVKILWSGIEKNQSGLASGNRYSLSNTSGAIAGSSTATFRRYVGISISSTQIFLDFTNDDTVVRDGSELYRSDTGAANAYVLNGTTVSFGSYQNGMTFRFKAANSNTGPSTVNIDALGVKTIKHGGTVDLSAGDIVAGQVYDITYDATNFQLVNPSGQGVPTGSVNMFAAPAASVPTGWLICDGSAVSRTTYASLFNSIVPNKGGVTVTIASPGVFSFTSHGLVAGDTVYLTTTGALPTGLTANTKYFVISAGLTANAFELSASRGGSAINTTGSQSGVHSLFDCAYGLGDGSTTFNVPDSTAYFPVGRKSTDSDFSSRGPGSASGEKTHQLIAAEMPSHTHNVTLREGTSGTSTAGISQTGANPFHNQDTTSAGGDGAHNNLAPFMVFNFIIKI